MRVCSRSATPLPDPTRSRQVYAITPTGRQALRDWLGQKPAPPRIQAEVMLRCLFATSGSKEELVSAIESTRQDVLDSYLGSVGFVEGYLHGDNPFPERLHANLLWMTLVRDLHMTMLDWADRTLEQIDAWTDTVEGPPASRGRDATAGPSPPWTSAWPLGLAGRTTSPS